jgi:hypothetical protein
VRRRWFGVTLLAGSWLFGLGVYGHGSAVLWALLVALGAALLVRRETLLPSAGSSLLGAVLLLPAIAVCPWPYAAAPALLCFGLAAASLPIPAAWPKRIASATAQTGLVLTVQGLGLSLYAYLTACGHELPPALGRGLGAIARIFGLDAAYSGSDIALYSIRKVHLLGATWELLLDPVTLAFLAGAVALLTLGGSSRKGAPRAFVVLLLVWLPLRAALLMGLLMHRTLLTDYDAAFRLMNQFWNPWVLIGLGFVPAFLAAGLVSVEQEASPPAKIPDTPRKSLVRLAAVAAGSALIAAGVLWCPAGAPKAGRVFVDEHHTTWEPTQRPFDTEWYGHDAGYNYACIYDYCSRFYDMSRLTAPISDKALEACDVLMLKVPTSAYTMDEVSAIVRFVERGGGIMLVGEHTDVFLTSSHLNQVARQFGFEFRKDCLFGIDSTFEQHYRPRAIPHPIAQRMPPMDFAVSCSIAVRPFAGRAAIMDDGLWNLPADYHASNFYPQTEDRAEARYGSFVQLWATRHGKGRVVAFGDSTIFSNFSTFEPGKTELMLGMIGWLNRMEKGPDPRPWLLFAGAVLAALGFAAHRGRPALLIAVAAGFLGWALAAQAVARGHRAAMPEPRALRPLVLVAIDRTVCDAPLSKAGFIQASKEGFGIFEQWILRLGYFVSRQSGSDIFKGDLVVFMHPHKPVREELRKELVRYVEGGGKVLVLDSALNRESTANSLLHPFGLSADKSSEEAGELKPPAGMEPVPVEAARTVSGGTPFAWVDGKPVAAAARRGKGMVVVIGFAARFHDDNMGVTTDIEPGPDLLRVFKLEYRLIRGLVEDTLVPPAETAPPGIREG